MESLSGLTIISLLQTTGLAGVFLIVFAESGLFIGFFLPGDSLLFTAGFLASQGVFPMAILMVGACAAAIAGDNVGYWFGKRVGPRLFSREDSLLFRRAHAQKAEAFYERHGGKTIILARFMPIVRTFAPIVAGVGNMNYRTFVIYNIAGGVLWTFGLSGLGYFLGSVIPNVDRYLLPIIGAIIALSVLPPLIHLIRERQRK